MRYYQFHIGDYTSHTRGLSLIEDLAYRRLIDECYLGEKPLEGDASQVARQVGMHDHSDAVGYVLNKFFAHSDGGWQHDRIDAEIAMFRDKTQKASRAGKLSAERRFNTGSTDVQHTLNERATTVQPTITHEPLTKNPPTPRAAPVDVSLFENFWSAYPRKVAKPEALKAWIKHKPDAELAAAIVKGLETAKRSKDWLKDEGQFIPHPATWLNNRRWEDEAVEIAGKADAFEGLL